MKKELNSRQFALYNYLKKNKDKWVTQEQIARDLPEYYPIDTDKDFHNYCTARKRMSMDIKVINKSGLIQKTILSSNKGVKIASREEHRIYIQRLKIAAMKRLAYVYSLEKKAAKDGQFKITFGAYERSVIEAFME